MKNTIHSASFPIFNSSLKFNKSPFVLLLFAIFLFASNYAYGQLPVPYGFESGFQGWTNNGNDSGRVNFNTFSCNGDYSIYSKDDQTNKNRITSPQLDLTSYTDVNISFCHKSRRLDQGEGFSLQYYNESSWSTERTFSYGTDFFNNGTTNAHSFSVTLSTNTNTFATNSGLRFSGPANANNDYNYFDDVVITAISTPINDSCTNAITLVPSEFCTPILGTTTHSSQSLAGCVGTADDDVWYSFAASRTEHTIEVEPTTLYDPVIEVFDSCGGSSLGCEDSTGGTSSESLSITGLSIGSTYYVRIYSYYNGSAENGEFKICVTTPCMPSKAIGTSTLGCPSVEVGGVGLDSTTPPTIDCTIGETTIEATYLELGDTSDYTVESIPFNPPFQFGCLENPVSVNLDDVFSPVITLPFKFCFYDKTYTSFVIGSNGVISFDTSLANGPSGWNTTNNIPNNINATESGAILNFGPAIFGVHHDIDPTIGGEVGYQLINLDTGCRALVASWYNVPMYYDNSLSYTGMIVFYEDTNVIEVYVKEKNIDGGSPWNDGNASIGLQADSNTATLPLGRNTLSPNWTATNEAWRFVPAGPAITDLKWYEGSISSANEIADPNDDGQITVSPSATTTYFAEVTYTLCGGSKIIETDETTVTITGDKTWNGSVSTAWENPNNWTPVGVPVATNCITIPVTANDPILSGTTDGFGYNLTIGDGVTLTEQSNASLTIEDVIIIEPNGDLEVQDSASVIQITDVVTNENTGNARVQREVSDINTLDYVYWSSPVNVFDIEDISPSTSNLFIYNWSPTEVNGTTGQHGTWINTTENMTPGKGYIVRGIAGTAIADTAEFVGTMNNGQLSYPISRGSYTGADYAGIGNTATSEDDNWNLLGNPYPSAISLDDFVTANPSIDGTLYFWRHLNLASNTINDAFYENYIYNYRDKDYLAANSLGSTPAGFNGYIASGQGFFALMLDSAPTPNTVSFNNTMRGVYANDGFYRDALDNPENKHRIWLDLVKEDNSALPILVGFADGATNEIDRLYDGFSINQSENQFYSLLSDQRLTIQGKALPFEDTDTIPLGYKSSTSGIFTLTINKLDGLFESALQDIYLEDTELNIIHDLRVNPYIFSSDQGTFDNRFILRFNAVTLSTNAQDILANVYIKSINKTINVTSSLSEIKTFELYDVTGRTIYKNLKVGNTNYTHQTNNLSAGTYIVKVSLENGATVSKKLMI